jgi:VanZ family protein
MPVVLLMVAIFAFSCSSCPPDLGGFKISDKIKHFTAYAILAAFSYRAFKGMRYFGWRMCPILGTVLLTSLYGVTDEIHQRFVPGRCCELADWLADVAGMAFILVIISIYNYLSRRYVDGRRERI